ncbi:ribonuclease Z [Hahella ganghwensis]|uniref:ribonuclease Z n=1 Tax=Hahella ganghwensis TaxID=286420 RepID=UPI00036CDB08|nr:ribonuclease Z [Hahella ganghwensis]
MEIIFLGTSSGTPTKRRNVSGAAIRKANAKAWYLVDCGEGTQHRLLETNLTLKNLQAICITHIHGDHCYGLPGLLASMAMQGRTEPVSLIGPKQVHDFIEGVIKSTELWLNFEIRFLDVEEQLSEGLQGVDLNIDAVRLSHRVPSFAYVFTEQASARKLDVDKLKSAGIPSGPIWGKIQSESRVLLQDGREIESDDFLLPPDRARRIIIAGDNDTPELLVPVITDVDVLVHEATYTQDQLERIGPGPQHSSAKRVAEFAESHQLPNLVLTHFSPRYDAGSTSGQSLSDIENEANAVYSGHLFLANDLECYNLKKNGVLSKKE